LKNRLLDISLYLGGGPVYWLYGKRVHRDLEDNSHYRQVLGINILLSVSTIIFLICFILQSIIIRFFRSIASKMPLEISFYIWGVLLVVILIIGIEGIIAALFGHDPKLKIYSYVEDNHFRKKQSTTVMIIHQLIIIAVIILAIHSNFIASDETHKADIYMLYDDMGYIPRWVFTLGFYPESLSANKSLGPDSVVVAPLTPNTLSEALSTSKLIFIASHGAEGYIVLSDGEVFWPNNIDTNKIGADLQYVYLAGCDTGLLHDEWKASLGNTEIKTFNRLSTVAEHMKWLLIDGPKIIRALE